VRGRYHLIPKHPEVIDPDDIAALTDEMVPGQNPESAASQARRAPVNGFSFTLQTGTATTGLRENAAHHE